MTTEVQKEADAIDCDLARIEARLERLDPRRYKADRKEAAAATEYVRMARAQVRLLMSEKQRKAAPY